MLTRKTKNRPSTWKLQDAKARFSELVRRARSKGPQRVTIHGREVAVVVSAEEFGRMCGPSGNGQALIDALRDPRLGDDVLIAPPSRVMPTRLPVSFTRRR
jgi:prevent-host-death family protein